MVGIIRFIIDTIVRMYYVPLFTWWVMKVLAGAAWLTIKERRINPVFWRAVFDVIKLGWRY